MGWVSTAIFDTRFVSLARLSKSLLHRIYLESPGPFSAFPSCRDTTAGMATTIKELEHLCEWRDLDEVRKGVEQCLALGVDINDPLYNPLRAVCCRRGYRAEFVSCLLEYGVDPNVTTQTGDTALHICASFRNDVESAKLLLAHGANPSVVGTWGQTVLHRAAFENCVQLLELFVDAGSDMTIRDDKGHTPLHTAASEDNLGAIEFLVQRGADMETRDKDGRTPLHDAAADYYRRCHLETVRLLLQLGADPNARDNDGRSVLEHHLTQVRRLSENDIKQGRRDDSAEVLGLLIDYGANVSASHQGEVSLLHVLASNHEPPLGSFDVLLDRGESINALNESGQTVLHVFCSKYSSEVDNVEFLLSRGAQDALVIEDANGNLPLHCLVAKMPSEFDYKDDRSLMLTFLKVGGDANLRNRDGMSPMSLLLFFRARTVDSSVRWRDKLENTIFECAKVLCSHGASWDDSCERRLQLLQQLWKPPKEDGTYDDSDLFDLSRSDEEEDAMTKQTKEVVASWMDVIKQDQAQQEKSRQAVASNMSKIRSPEHAAKYLEDKKIEANIPSPVLLLSGLRSCIRFWAEERTRGGKDVEFTDVPHEIYSKGEEYVTSWLKDLQESSAAERVSRSKICVVGASEWGKTSLVKSLTLRKPSLVHVDDRTIGIDLFSYRFQEEQQSRKELGESNNDIPNTNDEDVAVSEMTVAEPEPKNHEVTFWDFAGQDVYQAAHALFFSKRTLYLLCVDLERYVGQLTAAQQLSDRECDVVMRRYVTTHVIKWLETILARQVDAEFVLVATKADTVRDEKQIKAVWVDLQIRLCVWREEYATAAVKSSVNDRYAPPRQELIEKLQRAIHGQWLVVSSVDQKSVELARQMTKSTVVGCKKGFVMGKKYSRVRQAILDRRAAASHAEAPSPESDEAADERDKRRVENLIVPSSWLIRRLCTEVEDLEPDECVVILRTLSQLGDILWYEHRSAGALRDCVILDPLLVLDIVREVITHDVGRLDDASKQLTQQEQREQEEMTRAVRHEGRLTHKLLRGRPLWRHLDDELTASFKSLLQYFQLAYPARESQAAHDSDLIVPAYWKLSGSEEASESSASLPSIREVAPDQPVYLACEYVVSSSVAPTLFDQFAVQSYSPIFDRTISRQTITSTENGGDFVSRILVVPVDSSSTTEAIRIETAASDVDSAWLKLRFFVMMMEQVLEEYSGLYVMRDVVQIDSVSGEETRHRVSSAVHDIDTYAKMGKDATELVAKRSWLPSDMLSWFIEKAWRHPGRLQEIESRAFVRRMVDQAAVLQKLVVRGEKGRVYPSLWTAQYEETGGVLKLEMLSDLSGVCYHPPLEISVPSQFWLRHGTAIESGLWVFSNVIPEVLTLGVVQKVIETAAPLISGTTQRAQTVHSVIDRLDLSSQGVSTNPTSTTLSPTSARALLRDLLALYDPSFDELRVGELSNLQCAVSPSGSYVWAHPHEIKAMGGNKLTPCEPDYSAVVGARQQYEKLTKVKEMTKEDPTGTTSNQSQVKLMLTFEGLEGVSPWDSHKVFCSWRLVHESQQSTPLAVGSTDPNGYKASDAAATAATGAMVTWRSRVFEVVGVVSSVAMLRECRLEVQVKRASRLLGRVKDLGSCSQPLVDIMAVDDESLGPTLIAMPLEIAGSKATVSCTMAVETTTTESSAPQAP